MDSALKGAIKLAADTIQMAKTIVIAVHIQPDGDAFGSMLAFMHYLRGKGKIVYPILGEDKIKIPAQYRWMPGIDNIMAFNENIDAELLVALDCANEHRIGLIENRLHRFKTIINIDHHIDNSLFGSINVLDIEASATCEIAYNILRELGAEITSDIASCLYTGIVTDTGRFQYSNTRSETLRTAADLVDYGAEPNGIFEQIYENISFGGLKLLARVIERAKIIERSKLAYSYVKESDLKECGVTMADTETFIDQLRTAKEADAAVILKETPDGKLRASLRSKGHIDIGAIAREAGGGGHRNAAGANFEMTVEETALWISDRILVQEATIVSS